MIVSSRLPAGYTLRPGNQRKAKDGGMIPLADYETEAFRLLHQDLRMVQTGVDRLSQQVTELQAKNAVHAEALLHAQRKADDLTSLRDDVQSLKRDRQREMERWRWLWPTVGGAIAIGLLNAIPKFLEWYAKLG